MYQHSLDEQTYERESAAEEHSVNPRGDQVHLLQSEETSEMGYDSDSELGDRHETGRRQSYGYDSDSELEDHPQEVDEPDQSVQQEGGFCDAAERKQSRLDTGEFMGVTGPQDEEEE